METTLTVTSQAIQYKGHIIEPETEPWALKYGMNYRYYEEGDETIKHASSIEEAKDEIWEKVMTSIPQHKVVLNRREYFFDWIDDAIRFAVLWNAEEFIPGVNA